MMTTTRIVQSALEQKKTPEKGKTFFRNLQFHVALFLALDEAFLFQFVSKAARTAINIIWKQQFEIHFHFDVPRIQRMNRVKVNYVSEYKKCVMQENKNCKTFRERYVCYDPKPFQKILLLSLFREGKLEEIKKLNPALTLDILFTVTDSQERSVIQWAAKNGHQAILDYFFEIAFKQYTANSHVNHCAGVFNAPRIYWAACFNQVNALDKFLEEKDIDVNARTNSLETALHVAAYMGNILIVNKLLLAKAEVNAQKDNGNTPCYYAASAGYPDVVKLLLDANANTNLTGFCGFTALMKASQHGNCEAASILLNNAARVNEQSIPLKTALFCAVEFGHHEMLPLLIEAKADVNVISAAKESPIEFALDQGDVPSIKLLIDSKANVKFTNKIYHLLSKNVKEGNTQMVRTLASADLKWSDNEELKIKDIFDFYPEANRDIKKMLVVAEINQKLAGLALQPAILIFFIEWFLKDLKAALKNVDTNLQALQRIKWKYTHVFLFDSVDHIYDRACAAVSPAAKCRLG